MPEGAANGPKEGDGQEDKAQVQALQQELGTLRKELDSQKAANQEYLELAKRIQADFDNYRKRAQRDKDDFTKSANDRLVADLLNTLDDLDRASAPNLGDEELRKGVAQIRSNLLALLRSYGLREMPEGRDFDHELHEALTVCEGEDGRIYETYQKGYLIGNRVIRHAKVRVGRSNKEAEQNG
ncbi:MAG: nucleotide exchange factor GrpE [Methanomassiliicoccales archaeon]|jgi:molecular chaperone GrpE|nr:nucleotide exchange factor GrpE [Methanomassiliicoccales archaeon]MDD1756730.1 nucleotide exchange factor GrpE [Methanomassiliicoccales archaeon]